MKQYGYVDFLNHCHVSDPKDFFGFIVRHDGVWMPPPDDEANRLATPDELQAIYENFTMHDFSQPVLPLPCIGDK